MPAKNNSEKPARKTSAARRREKSDHNVKNNKAVFAVYLILRIIVIAILVRSLLRGEYESTFYCVLTLVLFLLPDLVQRRLKIVLPSTLQILIFLFIFAAEILGELESFFINVPHWDTMLHTTNGFVCAAIGFSLVDILNRDRKIKIRLSPFFMAVVAFCFSMTIGVLWEFIEFSADMLLHTDMQKDTVIQAIHSTLLDPTRSNKVVSINDIASTLVNGQELPVNGYLDIGLLDTMKDLFVNFVGAVVFSVIGFFYVKRRGKSKFARQFIPVFDDNHNGIDDAFEDTTPDENTNSNTIEERVEK